MDTDDPEGRGFPRGVAARHGELKREAENEMIIVRAKVMYNCRYGECSMIKPKTQNRKI
jgi:hypothetical protein